MDEHAPPTTGTKRARPVAMALTTPSPSRRRRRRHTGSSPGCVPRSTSTTSTTATLTTSTAAATEPTRAAFTPPPRRLLPPTQSSASTPMATAARTRNPRSTPVLRLDDDQSATSSAAAAATGAQVDQDEGDGASTGDDAFSVISGDGSPERDRHVLDFLSMSSLPDGTPAFSLFTPSPAFSKTSFVTRSIRRELVGGILTPLQTSPLRARSRGNRTHSRNSSSTNVSPSRFLRSPYARSHKSSSPRRQASGEDSESGHENDENDENELEPEPRKEDVSGSPVTPPRSFAQAIKGEPMMLDTIVCKLPDSHGKSSAAAGGRRNSLSLLRTPSPASSARARALRAKLQAAQLVKSTSRDPFGSSDDDDGEDSFSYAPSALSTRTHDQDWFFSFANTLSPLAPGVGTNEDDLETSFLSLRFSPVAPSSAIDLQRLLPPLPSPDLHASGHSRMFRGVLTPKTPMFTTTAGGDRHSSASSTASSTASSSQRSRASSTSQSSGAASAPRELNESFPNIRASTSATPGRDERLKLSSSSVMKMKLHVTFDQFPPSHTKKEMQAINNSLKRKKHARKRKVDDRHRQSSKTNGKAVQRKLLHTPVKEDAPAGPNSDKSSANKSKQTLKARRAQRQLMTSSSDKSGDENDDADSAKSAGSSASSSSDSVLSLSSRAGERLSKIDTSVAATPSDDNAWRRRLSPVLGTVSTPSLPLSLLGSSTTPTMHALKLRKPPSAATATALATPTAPANLAALVTGTATGALSTPPKLANATELFGGSALGSSATATPVKPPSTTQKLSTGATPLLAPSAKAGLDASSQLLTPARQGAAAAAAASSVMAPAVQSDGVVAAIAGNSLIAATTPKKKSPCNCKKSKCLKFYCECFASGGYCDESCNCVGCANTPASEDLRQKAIASKLEKNPDAFKPKIESTASMVATAAGTMPGGAASAPVGFTTPHGHHHHSHGHSHDHSHGSGSNHAHSASGDVKKMHKHGCHCKKSACQKRYCECFQAGVPCGDNCRCIDCKNQSPYLARHIGSAATPMGALGMRGPGGVMRELARAGTGLGTTNIDTSDEQFFSPALPSIRQRLRIDRETWARNFSSPFEVSPRRERERTERFRTQLKNSRASALLRSFNGVPHASAGAAGTAGTGTNVAIKSESGVGVGGGLLSFRLNTMAAAASFTSPVGQTAGQSGSSSLSMRGPQSLSPVSDSSRPPPAPTPQGKAAQEKQMKSVVQRVRSNPSTLEAALKMEHKTPGRVYVLPLFGNDLPPVKSDVGGSIFHFLTNADVYNASLVNRLWSRVTMGDLVWDHSNFRMAIVAEQLTTTDMETEGDGDQVMQ